MGQLAGELVYVYICVHICVFTYDMYIGFLVHAAHRSLRVLVVWFEAPWMFRPWHGSFRVSGFTSA